MSSRAELERIATQWISLWCVPVDRSLFDRLHADSFENCSSAGRPSIEIRAGRFVRRWREWDISAHVRRGSSHRLRTRDTIME
jgi:hypothetical protein